MVCRRYLDSVSVSSTESALSRHRRTCSMPVSLSTRAISNRSILRPRIELIFWTWSRRLSVLALGVKFSPRPPLTET